MKRLLMLSLVLIAGCVPSMTNDEIIAETKKCNDAGLYADSIDLGYISTPGQTGRIIVCGKPPPGLALKAHDVKAQNWAKPDPESFEVLVKETK